MQNSIQNLRQSLINSMPSHVHMIIGSNKNKLEDIVRDMKSFTSTALRKSIQENIQESRKEWIIWMMERAGKKNGNNNDWQFWQGCYVERYRIAMALNSKMTNMTVVSHECVPLQHTTTCENFQLSYFSNN